MAQKAKEYAVLTIMDYESCYERIWRGGLLKKAAGYGVNGRLWLYLKTFLKDRQYYIKVNDYKSPTFISKVGIPQGSVISPILCNMYTSDALISTRGIHAEFADDASLLNSDSSLQEAVKKTNSDLDSIATWCNKWNMSIAPEKTEVLIFGDNITDMDRQHAAVKMNSISLPIVKHKKLLGITLDDELNFNKHISDKVASGFSALNSLDNFANSHAGCPQSTFMRLYKALVLPVVDYGAAALVSAGDKFSQNMEKIQRSAMLKASGCLRSTSTDTLEILTNCTPFDLHIKLRQAQEVIRIAAKHNTDPLKSDFDKWMTDAKQFRGKPTSFQLLLARFNEVRDNIEIDSIEKEFEYNKELFGLSRVKGKVNKEQFGESKEVQVENIREILEACNKQDILVFTDGSSFGNPGPTGGGAAVYLEGYSSQPILLNKGVSKSGNNFSGEVVGIEIAMDFLVEATHIMDKKIHLFTDCQSAIISVFCKETPAYKVETILKIKGKIGLLEDRRNTVTVHWIPGHKGLKGNELADQQAKLAAKSMIDSTDEGTGMLDSRDAVRIMKEKVKQKWNNKYIHSDKVDKTQEIYTSVGTRVLFGEFSRNTFSIFNQMISGHCRLNHHMAKINVEQVPECDHCGVAETVEHFIFDCERYNSMRIEMVETVEDLLHRNYIKCGPVTLKVLAGEIEEAPVSVREGIAAAFQNFLVKTKRF
ncbi:uncharacterized protein LOC123539306 [Mercenaria mercenaria]|uniref:uncharacterized protein LOC123539306 n=1 Tax=Mercenaria mercenaria TaxID=6596 RepID=UPI00234F1804|nr:uncharacterized protein LOC123539306 [Mercenaria mercenaria]